MNSSGIKRGLATTAISALAVTGLPFLATSASAIPIEDRVDNTVGSDDIVFYAPLAAGVSDKQDGTNTTISLVTGGGSDVTSVQYQYQDSAAADPTAWNDVPGGIVARNADGVFAFDWANSPATVTAIKAVANTGDEVVSGADKLAAAVANTVELSTEGALGVFQEPYTNGGTYDATTSELLAVNGTVSEGTAAVTVTDASHGTGASDAGTIDPESTPATTASDTFNAVVDIDGYVYSGGTEPNQIALNAATNNTDDAEGSTLYVQTIGSIEVTPATQEDATPGDATVDIQVLDTTGQPVAGAEVFSDTDLDTDGAGPDTDTDGAGTLVGYTDGHGQIQNDTVGGAQTETYWVNTTNTDAYEPGTDASDTATVTTYVPALAEVDIENNRSRSNFDIDELSDGDDFTIQTNDQRGNGINENLTDADVEYRWVIDPSATGPNYTTEWRAGETDANGEFDVPALSDTGDYDGADADVVADDELPEGSYTLEARRPNSGGTGLTNATPETFTASESDISYEEGTEANAPIEGETTINGTLANDDGPLAGREVSVTYTPGLDSRIAPEAEQANGVEVTGNTAVVITDANGEFAIKLEDPAGPVVIDDQPETGSFYAEATGESATDGTDLQGDLGPNDSPVPNDDDNAAEQIDVNWAETPDIESIEIDQDVLDDYSWYNNGGFGPETAAPGSPVDLDITVFTADGSDGDTDPDLVQDYPVTVSVDKGFLSPNAEDEDDLQLDESNTSGLWGFFEDLGSEEEVSTGDDADAGIVAAIEDDADFDDNGLTTMTVTVTAGDVTEEFEIDFDARNFLNIESTDLSRADGEPAGDVPVGEEVDFDLFIEDQYGNLVGDQQARISDDSTVADFRTDEDFDQTLTDFTTSGPGITAFSDAPTVQTLFAAIQSQEVLVDGNDNDDSPEQSNENLMAESEPITWVEAPVVKRINPGLVVRGRNNGAKDDKVVARAVNLTEGATVRLFRKTANGLKFLQKATMNSKGNHKFTGINDKNGRKYTKYVVKVERTDATKSGRGAKRIR